NWQLQADEIIVESNYPETIVLSENTEPKLIVDIEISDELRREGWARDIVRHIQQTRKEIDLQIQDHILVQWQAKDENIQQAIMEHKNYIEKETLCEEMTEMENGLKPTKEIIIGDSKLMLLVEKYH
ncbi:MAG: hypothetical protein KAJ52_02695, partial [Sedimentisphaerales bacterium]|nr:hypothetical protein [Sedimentisphaerales bacterium]